MIKHSLIVFLLFASEILFAQEHNPTIKKKATTVEGFVPQGWKIAYTAKGDLNKDAISDVAIIIQNTNPENLVKNERLGSDTLDLNPRMLLVLFKGADKVYTLAAKNESFIPSPDDAESTCLADPLSETGAIHIEKGVLKLSYQYWLSCGSYGVTNTDYTFRFQNEKFELIGYDCKSFSRASGEESSTSVNFSTRKIGKTTGGNMFDDNENKPKTTTSKLTYGKLLNLELMTPKDSDALMELTY
ncbi:hypothetical protein LL912_12650 [Niabella sp. CC-SYL272]|uniref:hypothetical protein n=1 Tax=Niabella agricola TaxID=2891571 RepID=UPI001F475E62|nr:hypothetical protein [Niabella agricola]MCF3109622.1 hypothetical protein [Niabella agricola]